MEGFNFKLQLQLRYSDFDMLGHMNSAEYVTLIELGRLEYFRNKNWSLEKVTNVVASFKIDYLVQIVPRDRVKVWIRVVQSGNKSFKMEYLLTSHDAKIIYAKAETTQVCILKKDNTSTPIPDKIRVTITEFEGL